MKKNLLVLLITLSAFSGAVAQKKCKKKKKKAACCAAMKVELKNEIDSVSYALGISIGSNLKNQGVDKLNTRALGYAMDQVLNNDTTTYMEFQEANTMIQKYLKEVQERKAAEAKKEGQDYLAENGKKKGVTTLPSGLQYEVITSGNGPKPAATDRVKTHYHGTLIDGTVFDSSVDRGQPATFGVNQVIQGWVEALQLMSVGDKWRLTIPYNLAYGERGSPPKIAPFSTLVFEVELISIEGQ